MMTVTDDGKYTVAAGGLLVRGDSAPAVTVERGGWCKTYDRSRATVTVKGGGRCDTFGDSAPAVTVEDGGRCGTYSSSRATVTVKSGGWCGTYGDSAPAVTVERGGRCGTYGGSAPVIRRESPEPMRPCPCPECGADLTAPGAVLYVEEYDASAAPLPCNREGGPPDVTVYYQSHTVDSSAACYACGCSLGVYAQEAV